MRYKTYLRPWPRNDLLALSSAVFCLLLECNRVFTKLLAAAGRGALVVLAGVLVGREMADDLMGFDGGKCMTELPYDKNGVLKSARNI